MIAFNTPPSDKLKKYIQEIRFRHFICKEAGHLPYKPYPPRPEQCITFYPRGNEIYEHHLSSLKNKNPEAVICGQYTERINRFVSPNFMMITVVLMPGIIYRLTKIPMHELNNKQIELEAIFPEETRIICRQLNSSSSIEEMIELIENFFATLFSKIEVDETPSDKIIQLLLEKPGRYSLDWIANQACLSARQLERKFRNYVGIPPKLFTRIIRFNKSYELRLKNVDEDWLGIAIACGYYDYQHIAMEYKEFANASPNQFFEEEEKAPGRLLGLTKPDVFKWLKKEK
jgi:AraC-like DNA-binding protein